MKKRILAMTLVGVASLGFMAVSTTPAQAYCTAADFNGCR